MFDENMDTYRNPFASPLSDTDVDAAPSDVEAIRNTYLKHETSVKSIGTLYLIGAAVMIAVLFGVLYAGFGMENVNDLATLLILAAFIFVLGVIQLMTGLGLRKLKPWSRIVAVVLSVIGLLNVGLGTVVCAYFLYLLLSKKGKMVFSDEYREVMEQTPHIRYRTPKALVALVALLVVVLTLAVAAALLGTG